MIKRSIQCRRKVVIVGAFMWFSQLLTVLICSFSSHASEVGVLTNQRLHSDSQSFTNKRKLELDGLVRPEDFGAIGDGSTNDFVAIQKAIANLKQKKRGVLMLAPMKTYYINTDVLPSASSIIDLTGTSQMTIEGAGSTILTGRTRNSTVLFKLAGCTGVSLKNLKLRNQYGTLDPSAGQDWFVISAGAKNVAFENIEIENGHIGIGVTGWSDVDRVENISARKLKFTGVYYPQNFQGNGDNYFARDIVTVNCGRSYFPWNVRNHDVSMSSRQGGKFSDVLLKVYADPNKYSKLENIKLIYQSDGRYNGAGAQSPEEAIVAVDFQQASAESASAEIRDITVVFNVAVVSSDTSASVFIIRKYDCDGLPDARHRGYELSRFVLSGRVTNTESLTQGKLKLYSTYGGASWEGENTSEPEIKNLNFVDIGITPNYVEHSEWSSYPYIANGIRRIFNMGRSYLLQTSC